MQWLLNLIVGPLISSLVSGLTDFLKGLVHDHDEQELGRAQVTAKVAQLGLDEVAKANAAGEAWRQSELHPVAGGVRNDPDARPWNPNDLG